MAGFQGTSTRKDAHEGFAAGTEAERRDINTMIPGEVVSYDAAKQTATIKPRLRQKFGDKILDAPDLIDVPVRHARAGGVILHQPPKAGDEVMLHMAQRSLDQSAEDASSVDGKPARMHDLSDAYAVPGAYSKPKRLPNMPADRMHIGNEDGSAGIRIKDDGTVDIVKGGDSIYTVINDFLVAFRDHLQPGAHDKIGEANALIARVAALKAT